MKTNRILKLITLSAAIFGFAATSFAQYNNQSTATSNASATIIKPLGIELVDGSALRFGNIVTSATAAGTVVVAPGATTATYTGGAQAFTGAAAAGTRSAANFTVTGEPGYTYAITLPADETITISNGTQTMEVDTFKSTPGTTGTLSESGSQDLSVGATLHLVANQASGQYTGNFNVTVAYN